MSTIRWSIHIDIVILFSYVDYFVVKELTETLVYMYFICRLFVVKELTETVHDVGFEESASEVVPILNDLYDDPGMHIFSFVYVVLRTSILIVAAFHFLYRGTDSTNTCRSNSSYIQLFLREWVRCNQCNRFLYRYLLVKNRCKRKKRMRNA